MRWTVGASLWAKVGAAAERVSVLWGMGKSRSRRDDVHASGVGRSVVMKGVFSVPIMAMATSECSVAMVVVAQCVIVVVVVVC